MIDALVFKVCLQSGPVSVEIEIAIEIGNISEIDFDHDHDFDFDTDPDSARGSRTKTGLAGDPDCGYIRGATMTRTFTTAPRAILFPALTFHRIGIEFVIQIGLCVSLALLGKLGSAE
ncbi:hypothetical protein [Desulfonatronum sp. SC1]|uniref:hypothetical protein n=1 Tax=Desulfonatronum sp. SC1 TaxID=2109626 RepID=UPI000D320331|nr:hypothetical protein [Desulfonatronum sp. SC1]PTN32889.1 hypothetical protein C6366_15705 [Desulfonatronum sp. SC1]